MSGTPRPPGGATPCCQPRGDSRRLGPPPPATHATSFEYAPLALVTRVVPPTPMTHGDDAGYSTSGTPAGTPFAPTTTEQKPPVSPEEANTVWPCAAACM